MPTVSEHDVGIVQSLVMVWISGVSELSFNDASLAQLLGKTKSQVSLPASGDQITDDPIKDQAAPLDPHRLRD